MPGPLQSAKLRAAILFLAVLLLGLAIWFLGPLLAIGEFRPLASTGARIFAITMLLLLAIFALLEWTLSALGVMALCVLIWYGGPLLALGPAESTWHPLMGEWPRALLIAAVLLIYATWALLKLWHMVRNDEAFAKRIFGLDKKNQAQNLAKEEIRALQNKAQGAVQELRKMRLTVAGHTGSVVSFFKRLVEGKRYLYELPWYMMVGNPGAGKSSVITNAGLTFPLSEQMAAASVTGLQGPDRGTLNCNWWFTNEAVLIDTAGRYTAPGDTPIPDAANSADDHGDGLHNKNQAEWQGFLGVLRKARPRAPINGVLLTIDIGEICRSSDADLLVHAARLRARLGELRQQLGIRFPVYVFLTKADLLPGFNAYFAPLGTEARTQVWGFTLPLDPLKAPRAPRKEPSDTAQASEPQADPTWALPTRLQFEMQALQRRLAAGVATRLQEEYDLDRRQSLYLLPHEFLALAPRVVHLLDATFSDNRFDTTQHQHMLRGVYFTSATQPVIDNPPAADSRALVQRLLRALKGPSAQGSPSWTAVETGSHRSYFVTNALQEVVFPESHLVRPNLRWEARFRLLRLLGHTLVILLFLWLASALLLSQKQNHDYLDGLERRIASLQRHITEAKAHEHPERIAALLTEAQQLPLQAGLDLAEPGMSYQYGLYTPPPLVTQAQQLYAHLQDHLVLPVVIRRMEYRLQQALFDQDDAAAYETLRVYLLLHDAKRYQTDKSAASDLRSWVVADWQGQFEEATHAETVESPAGPQATSPSVRLPPKVVPTLSESFGQSAAMIGHLQALFSGQRPVQSTQTADEALVKKVRQFLDGRGTSERLYERAKRAVLSDAPREFSLVRVLGPQAGALLRRESGASLEVGVPGLFTYDGYHDLFAKRLKELVTVAMDDDAWAMGRGVSLSAEAASEKKSSYTVRGQDETTALVEDIRTQYLQEYAQLWEAFLADLRLREAADGESMTFEVGLIRQLAAVDSPLIRLGRQAARETTLSRPLQVQDRDKTLLDKASESLEKNAAKFNQGLGLRPEQRLERQIVDDTFAALREVVAGQPDPAAGPVTQPRIEQVSSVLNEYYTTLVVAQAAIESKSLPPQTTESANKLRIEAGKLPAPFRQVLLDVSAMGSDKVSAGAASILRAQARSQLDRLQGLLALTVTEPCRRQIAGRYPFATSSQEVAADDFSAFFGAGGAADEYFTKYLLPLVDTSTTPWRYRHPDSASAMVGTEGLAEGRAPSAARTGPTLLGELLKLLPVSGPPLEPFAQIKAIREAYFREPGAKRMSWKQDIKVASLDPTVTELVIDVDGQVQRYSHGPVQTWVTQWPGPRGGLGIDVSVQPRLRPDTAIVQARGPWAPLQLLEKGRVTPGASAGRMGVEFSFDGRKALLELQTTGINPLSTELLRNFKCPGV
ncbi:MAG: type VI secretion system membrane subunit TssM [Ideonella sp. MAG2]|nr:MAG: type VI secretion system membrane subunit TssM [Ideonella sp. MAG2]